MQKKHSCRFASLKDFKLDEGSKNVIGIISHSPESPTETKTGQLRMNIVIQDNFGESLGINIFYFKDNRIPELNRGDIISLSQVDTRKYNGKIQGNARLPLCDMIVWEMNSTEERPKYSNHPNSSDFFDASLVYARKLRTWWLGRRASHSSIPAHYASGSHLATPLSQYSSPAPKAIHYPPPSSSCRVCSFDVLLRDRNIRPFAVLAKVIHGRDDDTHYKQRYKVYLWDGTGSISIRVEESIYNSAKDLISLSYCEVPSYGTILPLVLWEENARDFRRASLLHKWVKFTNLFLKSYKSQLELSLCEGQRLEYEICEAPESATQKNSLSEAYQTDLRTPQKKVDVQHADSQELDASRLSGIKPVRPVDQASSLPLSKILNHQDQPVVSLLQILKSSQPTSKFRTRCAVIDYWPSDISLFFFQCCTGCQRLMAHASSVQRPACPDCMDKGAEGERCSLECYFQLIVADETGTHMAVGVIGEEARKFLRDADCSPNDSDFLSTLKKRMDAIVSADGVLECCIYSYLSNESPPRRKFRIFDTELLL
ncbi:uncharacterized protein LOC126323271 isoform X2 [Schistocerca gregaria]|uniref:uncharacterized protein LOC126323271 isoform X2 n=1 Tax=Schistocerca gregaria TaxID=7010 RepID=UPI00211E1019|nr:uncharacterized protein LOC126323271 isoform X2 [Schistocerca gregaria]